MFAIEFVGIACAFSFDTSLGKNVIAAYNCMTRKKSVRGKKRNVMLSFIVLMDHVVASKASSKIFRVI